MRALAGARADSRRRGHRARADGRPLLVPGHDAALRPAAGRRDAARRAAADAVLLRRAAARRRDVLDRPLSERLELLDSIVPAAMRVPRIVTADVDEAQALSGRRARARARRRDGQVARRAVRGRAARLGVAQGQDGAHARPRRARGRVGLGPAPGMAEQHPPGRARSRRPAASSCSARRSRA